MSPAERPHYTGHRTRLRERLQRDPSALADYELLELFLAQVLPRRDTKPLAKALLERFAGLPGVFAAPEARLLEVDGFGPSLAAHWTLIRELWARLSETALRSREVLRGPEEVVRAARARFGRSASEEFWAALLDNKNRVLAWERISRGTVDQTAVYPREVLALALKHQASGLILVHNHPGGDPTPSEPDVRLTARLARAADDLGLRVLDHLIVTEDRHASLQEMGLLEKGR
ncbi:MAG: DNA repair protein RadC [Desulfovibrio aminophilus]|uniref:RadC family protein n=1 Tax=Desulfovibrio aminophilus TaxID=81425 RepID=UPI0004087996|nr:DNA repair protein RadC [Desulfovibrio aminophilus]